MLSDVYTRWINLPLAEIGAPSESQVSPKCESNVGDGAPRFPAPCNAAGIGSEPRHKSGPTDYSTAVDNRETSLSSKGAESKCTQSPMQGILDMTSLPVYTLRYPGRKCQRLPTSGQCALLCSVSSGPGGFSLPPVVAVTLCPRCLSFTLF